MPGKRIVVQNIHCSLRSDNQDKSPGFQVTGYKELETDKNSEKIGFIISGIKVLIFQQMKSIGIRTRIKWIAKGFEIREEVHPLEGIVDPERKNNILFVSKDDNSMVVMQGEPVLDDNGFIGQIVRVHWKRNEITVIPQRPNSFHCVLDPRNSRIDSIVK